MGLQFLWIEANLLGFFLVDVRNSRGKFDEIKEKFVINPAHIASQSSLNAGGSQWTRDLPRNSLNLFTNRSKVQEQRENTWVFKGKISPKIVGNWSGRGSGFEASWKRSPFGDVVASIPSWFGLDSASIGATIALDRGYDQPVIGPRSPGYRASILDISLAILNWNLAPRSWRWFHDGRAMIAVRSNRDRGVLPWILQAVWLSFRWLDGHDRAIK